MQQTCLRITTVLVLLTHVTAATQEISIGLLKQEETDEEVNSILELDTLQWLKHIHPNRTIK